MRADIQAIARGAVAGTAATVVMSAAMGLAQRAGLLGEMPPKKITAAALHALGLRPPEPALDAAAAAGHLAFGAAAGALYGLARRRVPGPPPALAGAVFATAVWAASYAGWVPALGIMAPPRRDRPGRPASMLASHWVYGAALGALDAWLAARGPRPRRRQLTAPA